MIINGDLVDQYFTDYLSFTDFLENKDENYKKRISNWDPFYISPQFEIKKKIQINN